MSSLSLRVNRWATALFCLVMTALLIHAVNHRAHLAASITYDPLTLLPHTEQGFRTEDRALVEKAGQRQSQFVNDKLIFFITSPSPEQTTEAVKILTTSWATPNSPLKPNPSLGEESIEQIIDFYTPHHAQILSAEQRQKLTRLSNAQLIEEVKANISRPISLGISASQDPLGNLQNLFLQQMQKSPLQRNEQGEWQINHQGITYTVLLYQATDPAFSLNTNHSVLTAYEKGKSQALKSNPKVQILAAGIPMHSAAAAVQANNEMSLFGSISMIGLIALIVYGFKSIRAMILVALSLFFGLLLAFMTTCMIFGQIHVITLVFGTSLIGVAEDYGLHFIASRQKSPHLSTWEVRRHVRMGLLLALASSILAYACLGIPPFPGLRQIAVFSVMGLLGAWLTVILVFPFLTHNLNKPSVLQTQLSQWWLSYVQKPPLMQRYWPVRLSIASVLLVGLAQLTFKDDLKALQNSPQWLIDEQRIIGQALSESNTQYFIVTGSTEQQLLENEEALRNTLDSQISQKHLGGYRALSEWLPSIKQQSENEQLSQSKLSILEQNLGFEQTTKNPTKITPEAWLSQPVSSIAKTKWLGQQADGRWASVVSLHGQMTPVGLSTMQSIPTVQTSVIWVDNLSEYSKLMSEYRNKIIWLLLVAYAGTLLLLWFRYASRAIYILLPPAAASLITLAALGWLSVPVQLFTVLPFLLILGMGVDYGIFLVEHVREQQKMWMTISLGAVSTILSLGILVLSSTPALHMLGLTLSIGMTMTWLIAGWMGKVVYQKFNQRQNE